LATVGAADEEKRWAERRGMADSGEGGTVMPVGPETWF
jgi:hypothetical protein